MIMPSRKRILFLARHVAGGLGIHIIECMTCDWAVTDYCGPYVNVECHLADQLLEHARDVHGGFARLVEGLKP